MRVAVMQPYLFPYLGYFQLVNAADTFVFADDVNYIKGGWINRNKILFQNNSRLITFPCNRSQNKPIKEIGIDMSSKEYKNVLLTIKHTYNKAPFFKNVFPLLEAILNTNFDNISDLASYSIIAISEYLEINTKFLYTSNSFGHTKGQEKSMRLIAILKELDSNHYLNPIGGQEIYKKEFFRSHGIILNFLEANIQPYPQFDNDFVPNLSMIDELMFNSIEEIKLRLRLYTLL